MAQKWGVEINLGIFYLFIFFFFLGWGQNTFFKNGSLHTKIPAHTLFQYKKCKKYSKLKNDHNSVIF